MKHLFSILQPLLLLLLLLPSLLFAPVACTSGEAEEVNPLTNAQCLRDRNTGLLLPAHLIIGEEVLDNYMIGSLREALVGRIKITVASYGKYVPDGVDVYTPGETVAVVINMYWTGDKSDVTGLFRGPLDRVKRQVGAEMARVLGDVFHAFEEGLPLKVRSRDKIIFAYDKPTGSVYLHVILRGDDGCTIDVSHKTIFNRCADYPLTAAMADQIGVPGARARSLNVCAAMAHVVLGVLDRMKN